MECATKWYANAEQCQWWLLQRKAIGQTFHANAGGSKGKSPRGDPVADVRANYCQQRRDGAWGFKAWAASGISAFCRNETAVMNATGFEVSW